MEAKTFEIRDRSTFLPVLAVRLEPGNEQDGYLLDRAGFGPTPERQGEYVQLVRIAGGEGKSSCDPYDWGNRSMTTAHQYIIDKWGDLDSGAVVDVEFILGETGAPKVSEAFE